MTKWDCEMWKEEWLARYVIPAVYYRGWYRDWASLFTWQIAEALGELGFRCQGEKGWDDLVDMIRVTRKPPT